jgi:hypothetical protein
VFEELRQKLLSGQISFSQALPEALPKLRGRVTDDNLLWLSSELQGYADALTFYQSANHGLPVYRAVPGALYIIRPDGSFEPLNHPYASRDRFFLGAPISWIEEFSNLQGDESLVELAEFGSFISKSGGGGVVCACPKTELKRIIATFRNEFIKLLDRVDKAQGGSAP